MKDTPVVTCFLRHNGEVLLLRRSGNVGSYAGSWGGVAGYVEGTVDESASREIAEETHLEGHVQLACRGDAFVVEDEAMGRRWHVHPYMFDCNSRELQLDWEFVEAEWVSPTEIRRRQTVPELWSSYERVAPTVASLEQDREHGSSYLSLRALEVLRDRASAPDVSWEELAELAHALVDTRPSMVVITHRVNRAMHTARGDARAVSGEAHAGIGRAVEADEAAARRAAELISGKRVLTLSRSATVTAALLTARPPKVVVAESRPGLEGAGVAEALTVAGVDATLVPDATLGAALSIHEIEVVLVGADAVLPSGAVVNKVGTRLVSLAAREENVPVYVATAEDKVALREGIDLEPLFEVTMPYLVTGIVTEHGVLPPEVIPSVAKKLSALSDWG